MEIEPSRIDDVTAVAAVADTLQRAAASRENWIDYLDSAVNETDDMVAYMTFCARLGDMRGALARITADSPRGALQLALRDTVEVVSANSLKDGYMFGMLVNDELLAEHGVVSRMTLDRLAPHIDEIFDDILATSTSSDDLIWTFRLFGENMYLNTLTHPDDPAYNVTNNHPDPVKTLIEDICNELYPTPDDDTDFQGYERQEIDVLNFKHGFAIARRACNAYLLNTRSS